MTFLSAADWSGDGDLPFSLRLRIVWQQRLWPCVGHRPLHHAVPGVCGLWPSPLSRLHVAPLHHSLRLNAACVTLFGTCC